MHTKDATEHLAWCKERALDYLNRGDLPQAITSMVSDINKHPDTKMDGQTLGVLLLLAMLYVRDRDVAGVRRWIEGFR